MTATITGNRPDCVGDQPTFTITYEPPASAPSATPSSVTVTAMKPDGTTLTPVSATGSGLSWVFTAATTIDTPGAWSWKVVAAGTLVDVSVVRVNIKASPFD